MVWDAPGRVVVLPPPTMSVEARALVILSPAGTLPLWLPSCARSEQGTSIHRLGLQFHSSYHDRHFYQIMGLLSYGNRNLTLFFGMYPCYGSFSLEIPR